MENSALIKEARQKMTSVRGRKLAPEERIESAIELASLMLQEAQRIQTLEEKLQSTELSGMMKDPTGKAFLIAVTDQCFRSNQPTRIVNQLNAIIKEMGIPSYLSREKRIGLHLFKTFGKWLPQLFAPALRFILRKATSSVILPGEPKALADHMKKRRKEDVRINLNHLGEAILGEEEAKKRLQIYLDDLAKPEVEYISVKISTIYSQINLLDWDKTVDILAERLRKLLRMAAQHSFQRADSVLIPKFVNLDMEEYRDLRLTVDVFKKVLNESEFQHQSAGIVLQSYLPDSFPIQQELTEWAIRRKSYGGAPIKIRIVKGANLAMEQVEASQKGWPQAPYSKKKDTDSNYTRMLTYGMENGRTDAVFLGIASHNLFDIAYACLLSAENEVEDGICFEMLEGMADNIRRVVQQLTGDMLLYCPAATKEEFQYALAYLVRRLDENTAPENFLRHLFEMTSGSREWREQLKLFSEATAKSENVSCYPKRTQNRLIPPAQPDACAGFTNESDTDWSLPQNQAWAKNILNEWFDKPIEPIPLVIAGKSIISTKEQGEGHDPSRPGVLLYRYALADREHVEQSLSTIVKAQQEWQSVPVSKRSLMLVNAAQGLRLHRANLIGAMVAGAGKTIPEADVEVSEAIDFAEFYSRNIEEIQGLQDISWKPKGVILVAPPWNFPCSIPAGGILAALAAGNTVLFKPAPEAVLVGWLLAQALWESGVSKDLLHFVPCKDDPIGTSLIKDERINAIILTGATETAKLFLKLRPRLDLMAETGGKNAIIVSAASDRDLAVKDIVQSAFGHAGQKCSACSLVIAEAEVYDDPRFLEQLRDAAASLTVGSAWNVATKVNPLIKRPTGALLQGLTQLEAGETWLLEPKAHPGNPQLWSPGIKLGVKPDSFMHQTELFGPVLGLLRAKNLSDAIELANGTLYGLTTGLHSLDEREKSVWFERIEAGNCYINRGITGAIVQRQSFGGCKASSFGPGMKAGGPNYLMQLMHPEQTKLPTEKAKINEACAALQQLAEKTLDPDAFCSWRASVGSYTFFWENYFSKKHDPSLLIGQDNFLIYRPYNKQCVRLQQTDTVLDLFRTATVAAVVNLSLTVSVDPSIKVPLEDLKSLLPKVEFLVEAEDAWLRRCQSAPFQRVRLPSNPPFAIIEALSRADVHVLVAPFLANGRLELLRFLREVCLSNDYHRYGNLGLREGEKRHVLTPSVDTTLSQGCKTTCCCH